MRRVRGGSRERDIGDVEGVDAGGLEVRGGMFQDEMWDWWARNAVVVL